MKLLRGKVRDVRAKVDVYNAQLTELFPWTTDLTTFPTKHYWKCVFLVFTRSAPDIPNSHDPHDLPLFHAISRKLEECGNKWCVWRPNA